MSQLLEERTSCGWKSPPWCFSATAEYTDRMRWNPNLTFDGNCEEAFRHYEDCLGGKIAFQTTWANSPMAAEAPAGYAGKILHCTFQVEDQVLTGGDALPGQYEKPRGFVIQLNLDNAPEAERIFAGLADRGSVQMPLQETFWALRFGTVTDRFGIPWAINCEKRA